MECNHSSLEIDDFSWRTTVAVTGHIDDIIYTKLFTPNRLRATNA